MVTVALSTVLLISVNAFARTNIVNATIDSIKPIYMNYSVEKITKPCRATAPRMAKNCWNVNYKRKIQKLLKGYRVKLSYKGKIFTTRMRSKPSSDQLKIRVRTDLLSQPSNVAINAMVVY
jgi:hypothetical protein